MIQTAFVTYWAHIHLASLLLIAALAAYAFRSSTIRPLTSAANVLASPRWRILDAAVIVLAVAHCTFYAILPNFSDYGEPVIPILAGNYLQGAPVYADWTGGQFLVGSNYGPYVFLAQLPAVLFHPTILASKLTGIGFGIGSLVLVFLVVMGRTRSARDAIAICALMVALLSSQLHYWFWNRPDPILVAVVALATLLFDRTRPATCLVWLGLLAGIATNLKLFGAAYLVPLALACVPMIPSWTRALGAAAFGGILFAVAIVAPFALGVSAAEPYLANVLMMRKQGFVASASLESALYGLVILSLPLLLIRRRTGRREDRVMIAALVVCTLLVAMVAGKPGGGPPYMMPFVPLALYLSTRLTSQQQPAPRRETSIRRAAMCVVLVCAMPIWLYSWFQMAKQVSTLPAERETAVELRRLLTEFPASEIGHNAGLGASSEEFLRVEKAFMGQVVHFDYVNFADQRAAGLAASVVYPLFEDCLIPTWLLPRDGGRFLGTGYNGQRLLDSGAVAHFRDNYSLASQHTYFEVWQCNRHSGRIAAPQDAASPSPDRALREGDP